MTEPFLKPFVDDLLSKDIPPTKRWANCLALLGIVGGIAYFPLSQCTQEHREAAIVAQQQQAAEATKRAQKRAEEKRKGLHCVDSFDGSVSEVVRLTKLKLRDPESFEHIETIIKPVDDKGINPLMMHFRSRNGFGGMTEGYTMAFLTNANCTVVGLEVGG